MPLLLRVRLRPRCLDATGPKRRNASTATETTFNKPRYHMLSHYLARGVGEGWGRGMMAAPAHLPMGSCFARLAPAARAPRSCNKRRCKCLSTDPWWAHRWNVRIRLTTESSTTRIYPSRHARQDPVLVRMRKQVINTGCICSGFL